MYYTGHEPYEPYTYEMFVPKTPNNIGNETVMCYFLHHGHMDIDLKIYMPTKLKCIINNYKKYYYDPNITSRVKLTSDNRDDNYEYFSKTNRAILHGINDWYLNLQHTAKVNTFKEMKHDYFNGAENYTYEGPDSDWDECPENPTIHEYWDAVDVFRDSLANVTAPMRERIKLQILKQTLKPYQYWHDKKKNKNQNLKYSIEVIRDDRPANEK
ncbi:hypothetical protein WDU94_012498 [Cyamophila willieti]